MRALPGVCRSCRRKVYWNGLAWIEYVEHKHVTHRCPVGQEKENR